MGTFGLHPMPFLIIAAILAIVVYRLHRRLVTVDRAHRRELEEYANLASAMLVVIDRDARVLRANRMALDVLGYDETELIGADWFAKVASAKDRDESRRNFDRIFAGAALRGSSVRRVVRPDGTERICEWQFAARLGEEGEVLSVLVSGQDVTRRHAAEQRVECLRRLAQDVAANDDARQLVVDHAQELLAATSVRLVEDGEVTAARPAVEDAERPTDDADVVRRPVTVKGTRVADLEVVWSGVAPAVDPARESLLELLAQEMATALGRLQLLRSLERKAVRDVLTGVPNRRALDEELPRALARAERTGEPLSVAALDLNAFKVLNDTEGHDAGDRALKACAAAWANELRVTDMLVRIGGDEFIALLPECPADQAGEVGERLRQATPHRGGAAVGAVTLVAGETGDELLKRADQALYADKAKRHVDRLADPRRLAAVASTGLMRGQGDSVLDEITRTAQWLLDVPSAAVTLLDADWQLFASHCGLSAEAGDAGRKSSESFCQHAVVTGAPLIIENARRDARVQDSPAVKEHELMSYAGIPLNDGAGNVLGVMCVWDGEPRAWTEGEIGALTTLADRAAARLEQRIAESSLAA